MAEIAREEIKAQQRCMAGIAKEESNAQQGCMAGKGKKHELPGNEKGRGVFW